MSEVTEAIAKVTAQYAKAAAEAPVLSYETRKRIATEPLIQDLITPTIASHVLFHAEGIGMQAGSFVSRLIDALFHADGKNQGILALTYPGYVWAVFTYRDVEGGADWLRRRASEG